MPPPSHRYALDEDVAHDLAGALRSEGFDADSAKERDRLGLSDVQAFLRATEVGRIIVTANSKDFRALHEAWVTWRRRWEQEVERTVGVSVPLSPHSGVLVVPHVPVVVLVRILTEITEVTEDLEDRLLAWTAAKGWHQPHDRR